MTEPCSHRVISLGAGVQSTTLALLVKHGELPPCDAAVFADTGMEPAAVYTHLAQLEKILPFPVLRVAHGDLYRHLVTGIEERKWISTPPLFAITKTGKKGMLRRQCTRDFKIRPIVKGLREVAGMKPRGVKRGILVEQWIGISTDEADRMKPNAQKWIRSRWPLIDLRMSRDDCLRWLAAHGYARPPKSACIACPYQGDDGWRLRKSVPEDWQKIVKLDRLLRKGIRGSTASVFLHDSRAPIEDAPLDRVSERGHWGNECEGICGV